MGIGAVCAYLDHAAADLSHLVVSRAVMAVERTITKEAVKVIRSFYPVAGKVFTVLVCKKFI